MNLGGFLSTLWARRYRFAALGKGCSFEMGLKVIDAWDIRIGDNCHFGRNCTLVGPLWIGKRVVVNSNVQINAEPGTIQIGDDCGIGPNVVIRAATHRFTLYDRPIRAQGYNMSDIVIEDDVMICANSVITAGSYIGRKNVIRSNSTIRGRIEPATRSDIGLRIVRSDEGVIRKRPQ